MGTIQQVGAGSASDSRATETSITRSQNPVGSDDGGLGRLGRADAEAMGVRLQGLAVAGARAEHEFCTLVAHFDSGQAIGWYRGIKSTAHYLAWACGMTPAVAREHVRVARALQSMPATNAAFAAGRLSYSKVRELTRIVGECDETALVELALELTASQLARTVASYRTCAGTRLTAQQQRSYTMTPRGDGMVRLSICLPAEDAALITAAVEHARRTTPTGQNPDRREPASPDTAEHSSLVDVPAATSRVDQVQALVDIAASYLDTLPTEPDDDHTLVIVHVNAELLTDDADSPGNADSRGNARPAGTEPVDVPAGTSSDIDLHPRAPEDATTTSATATDEGVPAGTSNTPTGDAHTDAAAAAYRRLGAGTCHIEGHGPIEAATAQRLTCTSRLVGVLIDAHGDILALGRTTRLANRAQRRALRVREHGICQFPGCHQTRHVEAHHLLPWSQGGPTDLDNLVLLCRAHHTLVHEGGLSIRLNPAPPTRAHRYSFLLPDGQPIHHSWAYDCDAEQLAWHLSHTARIGQRDSDTGPTGPGPVGARHGGEGFSLHECVHALFEIQLSHSNAA